MSVSLVGQVAGSGFSTSLTVSRTTTAGNLLVACIEHQGGTVSSVTDTAGNVWVAGPDTYGSTALNQQRVAIWYCLNAAAVTSITATQSASSALLVNLSEWSGLTTEVASAVVVSTSGSSNTPASVTASVGDLVVGAGAYYESGSVRADTINSPYTALTGASISSTFMCAAYQVAAAGSTGPVWSLSPSVAVGAVTVQFTGATTATASGTVSLTGAGSGVGAATAPGTLTLTGAATAAGATTAAGTVALTGTASASASATASGSVTLTGTATATATAAAAGAVTLSAVAAGYAPATAAGTLTLTGTALSTITPTAAGTLVLTGAANASADTTAAGTIVLTGLATPNIQVVIPAVATLVGVGRGDTLRGAGRADTLKGSGRNDTLRGSA